MTRIEEEKKEDASDLNSLKTESLKSEDSFSDNDISDDEKTEEILNL